MSGLVTTGPVRRYRNYALINGQEVEYTEACDTPRTTSKWDDMVYLGTGTMHRHVPV